MKLQSTSFDRVQAVLESAGIDGARVEGDVARIVTTGIATAAGGNLQVRIRSREIDPMGNGKTIVLATIKKGTATLGLLVLLQTTINAPGLATLQFFNVDAVNAVNGTHEIDVLIFN